MGMGQPLSPQTEDRPDRVLVNPEFPWGLEIFFKSPDPSDLPEPVQDFLLLTELMRISHDDPGATPTVSLKKNGKCRIFPHISH